MQVNSFDQQLLETTGQTLRRCAIETIQVNVGLRCNQACTHCHVEAGPARTERMAWPTMEWVVRAARELRPARVDITGGAPELNPHLRRFVQALRAEELHVQVRTNLTVLLEPGMEDLPAFFRDHRVHLVASLPCYLEQNVDRQRGAGTYAASIEALWRLNAIGYGVQDGLMLDLVFNPGGPGLAPAQRGLEADYRRELDQRFGIRFHRLLTITNMPIGRFGRALDCDRRNEQYMQTLATAFNPATVDGLMCRRQISVGWDGCVYDCDFNLALRLPVGDRQPIHISQLERHNLLRPIITGDHCFGCAAGAGSSCGGALV